MGGRRRQDRLRHIQARTCREQSRRIACYCGSLQVKMRLISSNAIRAMRSLPATRTECQNISYRLWPLYLSCFSCGSAQCHCYRGTSSAHITRHCRMQRSNGIGMRSGITALRLRSRRIAVRHDWTRSGFMFERQSSWRLIALTTTRRNLNPGVVEDVVSYAWIASNED